jgi:DNA-binding SARP family transcriptional activator
MSVPRTSEVVHAEAFSAFPYGLLVSERGGLVVMANARASALLTELTDGVSCCALLGCRSEGSPLGDLCFTDAALDRGVALPEVRVDRDDGTALWITAAPIGDDRVVLELRPGDVHDRRRRTVPHWVAGPTLRVLALGRTRVESAEGPIVGRWLERRAGQLLKYLVAERARVVHTEEIADSLWAQPDISSSSNVRYVIHQLRRQIDPQRPKRGPSTFILSMQGGYALNMDRVWVDVDVFERDARRGLEALARGDRLAAEQLLLAAVERYRGDFLADEPYAQWALPERDRLRSVASNTIEALLDMRLDTGDLDGAVPLVDRLAELQPYDMGVHRRRIGLSLMRGRRSDAVRQYEALRMRMEKVFGERPTFVLSDVSASDLRG